MMMLKESSSTSTNVSVASSSDPFDESYYQRILPSVAAMVLLFLLSAFGNVTVFLTLVTSSTRRSRISLMILHLTIADLFVTFLLIPSEVLWRLFRFWVAGNLCCKFFAFFRAFGFYLSSMVLIVVSLDRYIAVVHPLKANSGFARRGHFMIVGAWVIAAVCSIPQIFVWSTKPAPDALGFEQCVTFGSDQRAVKIFTIFFLTTVYFIPLTIMILSYYRIFFTINKKSKKPSAAHRERRSQMYPLTSSNDRKKSVINYDGFSTTTCIRQEDSNTTGQCRTERDIEITRDNEGETERIQRQFSYSSTRFNKARARTLRMTIFIVLAFIACWTPNVVMTLWFLIDSESAHRLLDPRLADVLFILTITNSVLDPYVYGSYASEVRKKCLDVFFLCHRRPGLKNQGGGPSKSLQSRNLSKNRSRKFLRPTFSGTQQRKDLEVNGKHPNALDS